LAVFAKAAVHFGLAPPYRFERVLLGAFACLLMAALAIGVLWLSIAGELPRGSPRFAYFGYLTVLLILALVAVRWPRLCAVLLVLATIDIVWGLGSFALDRRGGTVSLLPPGTYEPQRFQWNALLQVVPIPSLHTPAIPDSRSPIRPKARAVASHDAATSRGTSWWRPSAARRPTISARARVTHGVTG